MADRVGFLNTNFTPLAATWTTIYTVPAGVGNYAVAKLIRIHNTSTTTAYTAKLRWVPSGIAAADDYQGESIGLEPGETVYIESGGNDLGPGDFIQVNIDNVALNVFVHGLEHTS